MSIVLIRQDGKLELWKNVFTDLFPELPVYHFREEHPKADISMAIVWKHPPGSLKPYPNLKCIASFGAGVDFIFEDPDRPPDVPITRVVDDFLASDMAEHVVTVIMGHLKNMKQYAQDQKDHLWEPKSYTRISDHNVGIMGAGTLGSHLGKTLLNMGFKVAGWAKHPKKIDGMSVYHGEGSIGDFLAQTSILVCLLPLTPETSRILNRNTLSLLPRGAFLINVARGGHLAEDELIPLLDSGQLSGACLDVFEQEPLPGDHPFWGHPHIQITPHVASVSDPRAVVPQLASNFGRLQKGQPLMNQIDLSKGY